MKRLFVMLLATICFSMLSGCAGELPVTDPDSEISHAMAKVREAEKRTKVALDAAVQERKIAEALLDQAKRVQLETRKECDRSCKLAADKKLQACLKAKKQGSGKSVKSDEAPKSIDDPKYSPSDAPEGWN